jgi:YspA, cpYpsA-related SLOG family
MSKYRVLVTGSREWADKAALCAVLDEVLAAHPSLVIVNGRCPRGADAIAVSWVMDRWTFSEADVSHEDHPADWHRHKKQAGFIRNAEMVALGADLCLAFYQEGEANKGTDHCARTAENAGIPVRRITS